MSVSSLGTFSVKTVGVVYGWKYLQRLDDLSSWISCWLQPVFETKPSWTVAGQGFLAAPEIALLIAFEAALWIF